MKKGRILIVDKDERFISRVRGQLHRRGYSVFRAGGIDEALARLKEHRLDLILIDERLASLDGRNLCQEIRQFSPEEFIPIIVLMGIKAINPENRYLEWGADECVHKWAGMKRLVSRIYSLHRIRSQYNRIKEIMAYNEEISSNIPVSILILTQGQMIRFANNHFCRKMRLDALDIVDNKLKKVLTPHLYDILDLGNSIREVRSTGLSSKGYKVSYGGDYYFYKLIPIKGMAFEKPDIMLMMQDVTDMEELARELRRSEERYRNLFSNSVEPIAMVDIGGRFVMANERVCGLFGYSGRSLSNKDITQLVHDEDADLFDTEFQKAIGGRQGKTTVRMMDKKGDILHIEMSIKRIKGKEEDMVQIIMRDVTKRLELEDRLRQSEKLSALGQFTAGATHEINNPLSIISAYVQYLLSNYGDAKPRQLRPKETREIVNTLNVINRETLRCGKIVNNLLQFARKAKLETENLDINEIMGKTLGIMGRQLKLSGIKVTRKMMKKLPRVKGNYNLIQQVFMNIILNAREAMPDGGGLLVRTGRDGRRLTVEIRDTGKGIPKEEINRIFDPFYTTRAPGRGTGLGLSVVHSIIKDHGGGISVKSRIGEGSSFFIRLPVKKQVR